MAEIGDRSTFLGATDVVAICGLSPFASPLDVWLEKTGQRGQKPDNPTLRRGRLLEPVVAQLYSEYEQAELVPVERLHMAGRPYLAASPDRLRVEPAILVEIKTHRAYIRDQYGDPWTDAVPEHILGQITWQMHVPRHASPALVLEPYGHVAAWFDATEFGIWRVEYDEDIAERMEARADAFWHDCVLADVPPQSIGHPAELEALRQVYPRSTEVVVQADETTEMAVAHLRRARRELAEAEERVTRWTAIVQQAMGNAAALDSGEGQITWRTSKPIVRRSCDYDGLRAAHPSIYEEYITETTTEGARRFCVPRDWSN